MAVLVRIPTPLRTLTKGVAEVQADASTVTDLIDVLERQFPGLGRPRVRTQVNLAQLVIIAARVGGKTLRLLRRHVGYCAEDHAGIGARHTQG